MKTDAELAEEYRRIDEERNARIDARAKERKAEKIAHLQSRPSESKTIVRSRAVRFQYVAMQIESGLNGSPFHWNGAQRHFVEVAGAMGISIVTRTAAEKAGFELKRGAKPVGFLYFGAPISRNAPMYILECQFKKKA